MIAFTLGVVALMTGTAKAGPKYSFSNITGNNVNDANIGEAQLSVEVNFVGSDVNTATQVSFTFRNEGTFASSITDVYFDDGGLLGIASITNGSGVAFSQGASPGDLPGGNAIDFNTSAGFLSDSDPPAQPNGVNPGEILTITFDLLSGSTYQTIIDALQTGLDNPGEDIVGGLRIGIHVQGFAGGGSESFVNGPDGFDPFPPTIVPEPSTIAMAVGVLPLAVIGWARHRRRSVVNEA
jgi:hypothetical protein